MTKHSFMGRRDRSPCCYVTSMKIVIDMNLSPQWVQVLMNAGHEAVHWSTIGAPNAPDREIMAWAQANGFVVFTHDLDFGNLR